MSDHTNDDDRKTDNETEENQVENPSRRSVLKGMATGAAVTGAATVASEGAQAHSGDGPLGEALKNPYGGRPAGGISLPEYFRPTKYMTGSNANYFPLSEELGPDEMRISFCGSTPYPPREDQAGTCIMVELGNGKRFFFDFGSGCVRNIIGMQVPGQLINDIFITHLHVDHYADIPYIYPFRAWSGGYTPLRIHGPSGRTPELGTQGMVNGMQQMMKWHLEAFDVFPIGDGYEIEVNEFDYREEGGIVYDQDGVVIRSWPRSHAKDGAVGYRLDWNGLSFVWTGDGRPDELSRKYGEGVDVFVTEMSGQDIGQLMTYKYGLPQELFNYTIDTHHTSHYAVGKLFADTRPRLGMVTHYTQDEDIDAEMLAGIRAHYDGLFQWGLDVAVVNVTKEAIWYRKATLPGKSGTVPPFRELAAAEEAGRISLPDEVVLPEPRSSRAEQQDQKYRDMEIDPKEYYPADVFREPGTQWPSGFSISVDDVIPNRKKPE
ncbi:guanitoxin biosynthesis MBL fold metallo-hydrolase GntH [Roseibium sp.]|uniref:guanitoxin biosynthesis MBL fold metallo-hydrolase GntH n=1 Tax=Roseibium sp. TaxID=1936156 RepID=UPI003BA8F087